MSTIFQRFFKKFQNFLVLIKNKKAQRLLSLFCYEHDFVVFVSRLPHDLVCLDPQDFVALLLQAFEDEALAEVESDSLRVVAFVVDTPLSDDFVHPGHFSLLCFFLPNI